jgi:hypothetical protein
MKIFVAKLANKLCYNAKEVLIAFFLIDSVSVHKYIGTQLRKDIVSTHLSNVNLRPVVTGRCPVLQWAFRKDVLLCCLIECWII